VVNGIAYGVVFMLAGFAATDVASVVVSPPRTICVLDMNTLKGEIRRLSWSADNTRLHVQTADRGAIHDYIVTLPEGVISPAFGEPEWAAEYWTKKSSLSAPGSPDLRIEVIEDHQRTKPTPFTGGFTAGGAQSVDQRNPVDTFAIEVKLKLLGQEVGYFLNDVAMAGFTYGWGPADSGAIAFVDEKGRVVLFDRGRRKKVVPGTKDALMPAWSADGTHLAFLQKIGRRSYRLAVVTISQP
jgi:hypothetical protein